jgi:hypothetical protein
LIADLNNINLAAGGFLLNKPHLYDSNIPPQLVSYLPNVQAAINGQFNTEVLASELVSCVDLALCQAPRRC